jgi:hypothetical protein
MLLKYIVHKERHKCVLKNSFATATSRLHFRFPNLNFSISNPSSLSSVTPSLQEIPVGLGQLFVIVRLESQPALLVGADLRVRELGLLIGDELDLVAAAGAGRVSQQLCVARLVERDEPECGGIDLDDGG